MGVPWGNETCETGGGRVVCTMGGRKRLLWIVSDGENLAGSVCSVKVIHIRYVLKPSPPLQEVKPSD